MKLNVLVFCLQSIFCMAAWSQTAEKAYYPFAEQGKQWEIQLGETPECAYENRIDGDTLIDGERWCKVYNTTGWAVFDKSYYMAIRDVGQKVYAIAKGSRRSRLLYDFNVKEGSVLRCGVEGNAFGCLLDAGEQPDTLLGFEFMAYLRVESIDTVSMYGKDRRRFKLTMLDAFKDDFLPEEDGGVRGNIVWVEGVGSGAGPFMPWTPILPNSEIPFMDIYCAIGKSPVFSTKGFYDGYETSPVVSSHYSPVLNNPVFGLQGRRLGAKPRKGIYIENGRKQVVK